MYPIELDIEDTTGRNTYAFSLNLLLSIGRDSQLHTSNTISMSQIFYSWVTIYQLRPPMASLSHSLYDMPGLSRRMNVLFWGRHNFKISFWNRDTSRKDWNRHWRRFMVDTGILSSNTKFLSHVCYMTFCSLTKYNENPPKIRLNTNPWPSYRIRPFYRPMRGLHTTFATGVNCWQGTLTPPDTWSWPNLDLRMLVCWDLTLPYLSSSLLVEHKASCWDHWHLIINYTTYSWSFPWFDILPNLTPFLDLTPPIHDPPDLTSYWI